MICISCLLAKEHPYHTVFNESLLIFRDAQNDSTDQRSAASPHSHPEEQTRESAGELH